MAQSKYVVERSIELFIESCVKADTARMATEVYPNDVEAISDFSYADDKSEYHKYDLYVPKKLLSLPGEDRYKKVALDIHGGGFVYGLKEINKCCNMTVASLTNMPVVSINYNLCPTVSIVTMLNEIMSAIKHIVATHGTREITIMGDSAGGYLALATWALLSDEKVREDFKCDVKVDVDVSGLVLICPAARDDSDYIGGIENTYFADDADNLLPSYGRNLDEIMEKVSKEVPPTVLITSDKDFLHDVTVDLFEKMKAKGIDARLFDGVTKENGNELTHVYVVGHPDWEESKEPLELITRLIVD